MRPARKNTQAIYGRNPIIEALQQGNQLERVYLKDNLTGELEKEIRNLCREHQIPLKRVPNVKLEKMVHSRNHQGVVALMSLIEYQSLQNVIPHLYEQGKNPKILILDNITDIRNIGAIARSCEVLGVHAMVLSGKNSGYINEDAVKTSAGALFRLPVCREKTTLDVIQILDDHGIKIVGTSLRGKESLSGALSGPVAVVMGSEYDGLHITIENKCHHLVKIPQLGSIDSLNVSVAAGIMMYEMMIQNKE